MQSLSRKLRSENKTIGFVPTMGALHEGHLNLVRCSKDENDVTVVSIFVNPVQFGPKEDFKQYPRDIVGDLKKLSSFNVDAVFIPDQREMYPEGFSISIDVGHIGQILCGVTRPWHFNGVATVVAKLFNIVMPDRAYFGQKDFQQTVVIKKLVRELNFGVGIIICPTVRESDGLAMSSRNSHLRQDERKVATILYRALKEGEALIIKKGIEDSLHIKKEMERIISSEPLARIEYIEIIHPDTLMKLEKIRLPMVICLAARIGETRLIDNIIVE